ncbi:monocarboxylate transporter [Elysia marginata]|uniref:Monocarboxylate transporter n=1 Tax=Elysia marginata TaxID=1093978 RepID=A0AAV4INW4_9GAST|nr:monocarboxylate transporter [Elysia marginata]
MSVAPVAFTAPDGGYGWVIVFSSFFIHFMCNGLTLAMGVLCVSWYQEFNSTKTETSWVVSATVAVMLAMGPFASSLAARIGYRAMAMTGACFITVGSLLSSIAGSIQVLMLTLGVIGGIGAGMCYLPAVAVPAFYFEKRRSLAMGLGTAGIGGGMFLLAPVINWLIHYYGWRGTMVVLAGFSFNLCVAGALMRPLDALRMPREKSILVRYPNSEATSDTESLVQSYEENDPMRELKMKLGRITLDSNSDSDLTSEGSKGNSGLKTSDNENVFNNSIDDGSHTTGSEPMLPNSSEATKRESERNSPKIPTIVIDPFPAIDMPLFEYDKDSGKNSAEFQHASAATEEKDNLSNKNIQNRYIDSHDSKGPNLNIGELPSEDLEHCSCDTDNISGDDKTLSQAVLNNSVTNIDSFQRQQLDSKLQERKTELKSQFNELASNSHSSENILKSTENNGHILDYSKTENTTRVTQKSATISHKSKRLEQLLHVNSDSSPSLPNGQRNCCQCGNDQEKQSSSHSKLASGKRSDIHGNSTSNRAPQIFKMNNHRHIFEQSQHHHSSLPDNSTYQNPRPNSSSSGGVNFTNEDHKNNNHYTPKCHVSNINTNDGAHLKITTTFPSKAVAQARAANHVPDMSTSVHSSMASVDCKATLAPNILLNDTPMGGSMTVLQSEVSFPLTEYTDVEACKQFRSLLGLDLGHLYQVWGLYNNARMR